MLAYFGVLLLPYLNYLQRTSSSEELFFNAASSIPHTGSCTTGGLNVSLHPLVTWMFNVKHGSCRHSDRSKVFVLLFLSPQWKVEPGSHELISVFSLFPSRYKPFFPFQVQPPLGSACELDLSVQDSRLVEGRLKVTLIECSR